MLLFLLIFQAIILFITVLCHKMVKVRYRQIKESMRIFTNTRAYRTNAKVCFIEDVLNRYKTYVNTQGETPMLETMIEGELYKYNIGKFSFIGVNNIALKSKIIMRYVILLQIMIMVINEQIKSLDCIIMLSAGIIITIIAEIFVIVNALDRKESALVCEVKDYIVHKYPVELYNREINKQTSNKNIKDGIHIKSESEVKNEIENEIVKDNKNDFYKGVKNNNLDNNKDKHNLTNVKLTTKDIEEMIISMDVNK